MATSNRQGSNFRTAIKVLTNAEIIALNTTAVEIIPAPGAGRALMVPAALGVGLASLVLKPLAVDYTNVNGGAGFVFQIGSAPAFKITIATGLLAGFFAGAPNPNAWQLAVIDTANQNNSSPNTLSDLENQSLTLKVSGNGGNFTGGDAANLLTVTVPYYVIDL